MRRLLQIVIGALSLAAIGCATNVDPYTSDADSGSTHALVTIERSAQAGDPLLERGEAIARFVSVPAESDSASALSLIGLALDLPPNDECSPVGIADPSIALSSVGPVELLEVGEVSIEAEGDVITLAPHAFPTVSNSVAGVVYTTRDRSPLPDAARYSVVTTGSDAIAPIRFSTSAPSTPHSISLGGVPLSEVGQVPASEPLDVTWAAGDPQDVVYLQLVTSDTATNLVCAFPADRGAGSIPGGEFSGRGAGRVSVHGVRSAAFESVGVDDGEVRFDFQVGASVEFVD